MDVILLAATGSEWSNKMFGACNRRRTECESLTVVWFANVQNKNIHQRLQWRTSLRHFILKWWKHATLLGAAATIVTECLEERQLVTM